MRALAMVFAVGAALSTSEVRAEGTIAPSQSLAEAMTQLAAQHAPPGGDHLIFYAPAGQEEAAAAVAGAKLVFEAHPGCGEKQPGIEYTVAPGGGGYVIIFRFASNRPQACPREAAVLVERGGAAQMLGGLDIDEVPER